MPRIVIVGRSHVYDGDVSAEIAAARNTLHEAMELQKAGNLSAAEPRYRRVVELGYRPVEVLPILTAELSRDPLGLRR